jgi:hypothetical protein
MTVSSPLRRKALVALFLTGALAYAGPLGSPARAQSGLSLQITQPDASGARIASGRDYATEQFGDPWDMNESTDVDLHVSAGVASPAFGGGIFSANAANSDAGFYLLDVGLAGTQRQGRTGKYFAIDTSTYRELTIRMYVSVPSAFQVFWYKSASYVSDIGVSQWVNTKVGWHTYTIDLSDPAMRLDGLPWLGTPTTGLRIDPTTVAGSNFQIDWVRLTAHDDPSTIFPVSFDASDPGSNSVVNLYLDNDANYANGTIMPIATNLREDGADTASVELARYAPGTYYVVGRMSRDYASLVLDDPWDMSNAADVAASTGFSSATVSGGVFSGTTNNADPVVALPVPVSGPNRIDTSIYRSISFQMTLSAASNVQVIWQTHDGALHGSTLLQGTQGSNVYTYNLAADPAHWYGFVSMLRIDPTLAPGVNVSIDWVSVNTGGALTSAPTTATSASAGPIAINTPPIAHLLQPDAMGGLDYASYTRNDPWNMAEASDVDLTQNFTPQFLRDATVEGVRGDYLRGTGTNSDPAVFFVYGTPPDVDANKFKNLTFRMSISGAGPYGSRSVARVFWQRAAAGAPIQTSDDILVWAGLNTYVFDMTTIEKDPGVVNPEPWGGTVNYFRIDPHEESVPIEFFFDEVRLAADDESNRRFAVTWSASDPDDNARISLYYDTDRSGFNGTAIATNLEENELNNTFIWDTRGVPNGTYYVYAVISDGLNTTRRYATGRLVVNNGAAGDTTAPIGALDPSTPTTVTSGSGVVNVQGWALDNVQIASVQLLVDGTAVGRPATGIFRPEVREAHPNYPEASEAGFQMSFNTSGLGAGPHSLTVAVYDTAGNRTLLGGTASGGDTAGVYVPSTGYWFLRNSNSPGAADLAFSFGPRNAGWTPLVGDWDGDGVDTPGLYDGVNGTFFLKNTAAPGASDLTFSYGARNAGWRPLVGDWDGDGVDTVGLYAPSTGAYFLRNTHGPGAADIVFSFGPAGGGRTPLSGDWDHDGDDTIGLYDPAAGAFFLKNTNAGGPADLAFSYGPRNATPVVGDWNNDGTDTIGVYVPSTGTWFLRNTNGPGAAHVSFSYGPANMKPVAGDWNGAAPKW